MNQLDTSAGRVARPAPAQPENLAPELAEVLGWPNFKCAPVAHVFQAAGYDIRRKAEAEQAFVLHWLVTLVLKHGAAWFEAAAEELAAVQAIAAGKVTS